MSNRQLLASRRPGTLADEYEPSLPTNTGHAGPNTPSLDLSCRNGRLASNHPQIRNSRAHKLQNLPRRDEIGSSTDLRFDRKMDRKLQKERLGELNPRAEPGRSREHVSSKKKRGESCRQSRIPRRKISRSSGGWRVISRPMKDQRIEEAHIKPPAQKSERELRRRRYFALVRPNARSDLHTTRVGRKDHGVLKNLARQRYG